MIDRTNREPESICASETSVMMAAHCDSCNGSENAPRDHILSAFFFRKGRWEGVVQADAYRGKWYSVDIRQCDSDAVMRMSFGNRGFYLCKTVVLFLRCSVSHFSVSLCSMFCALDAIEILTMMHCAACIRFRYVPQHFSLNALLYSNLPC